MLRPTAAGTPMGELLRRYWHPIAVVTDLSDEKPIKSMFVLSERYVLFRDKAGRVGLIQEYCPHAGGRLAEGRVSEQGIVCSSHNLTFDIQGNCLVTSSGLLNAAVRPVREYAGLYWAHFGSNESRGCIAARL